MFFSSQSQFFNIDIFGQPCLKAFPFSINISIGRAEAEEVVAWRCSVKKVFLKILQNSQ